MEQIQQVAATDSTVLLLGETGTGKELFATQIHELGNRHGRAMVRVNCGAIPSTLIESELFGREKGAFTGALARQVGRFELADHSTIFLDEIGDLPSEVQVKLLRVLEERQIERLGSPRPISIDTRIIAATHRNLEQRIADGAFREDLYYRLNVFPIHVPPLRERAEDIPLLVWRFVEEFSKAFGKRIDTIDKDSLTALQQSRWPGNIRELRNVVERAMIVGDRARRLTIAAAAIGREHRQAQPEAHRRREGSHPRRAREHRLAHPRRRRRRRPARVEADDARNPDGEARPETSRPPLAAAPTQKCSSGIPWARLRSRGMAAAGLGSRYARIAPNLAITTASRGAGRPTPAVGTTGAQASVMVRLSVALSASSSRCVQDLLEALRFLMSGTRLEPGCRGCSVWVDPDSTLQYVEEWDTEADMRQRVRSPRFTSLLGSHRIRGRSRRACSSISSPSTRGLDYVAQVRSDALS